MLKGTLDDFTMPDIFRLLSFTKKTGKLEVVRSAGDGKVFFRDGEVYYAVSSLKREPLGQKLIRLGALTEGQLRKALDLNAATGERVGEILLRQGDITEEQLINGVRGQIEDAAFDLLRWEIGDFVFEAHERFNVEIPISVSVENLIMEASRRTDELEIIRRKIPSNDVVLVVAAAPPEGAREINITPDEWRMLVLVDGVRTVGEIMELAGADEFTGLRVLFGLISSGLVDVESLGPAPDTSSIPDLPAAARPNAAVEQSEEPEVEQHADEGEAVDQAEPTDDVVAEPTDDVVAEPTDDVVAEPAYEARAEQLVPEEPVDDVSPGADEFPSEDEFEVVHPEPQFDGEETLQSIFEGEDASDDELGVAFDRFQVPLAGQEEDSAEADADDDVQLLPRATEYFDPDPEDSFDFEPLTHAGESTPEDWAQTPEFETAAPGAESELEPTEEGDAPEVFLTDIGGEESFDLPAEETAPEEASEPVSQVDRAAVVRELAGLFSDEVRPRRPKSAPAESDDEAEGEGDGRKRVEDDDQVNKKLINRLIDGVKGL